MFTFYLVFYELVFTHFGKVGSMLNVHRFDQRYLKLRLATVLFKKKTILTIPWPPGGGGKLPPEHIFAHYSDISTSSQNSFRDFS